MKTSNQVKGYLVHGHKQNTQDNSSNIEISLSQTYNKLISEGSLNGKEKNLNCSNNEYIQESKSINLNQFLKSRRDDICNDSDIQNIYSAIIANQKIKLEENKKRNFINEILKNYFINEQEYKNILNIKQPEILISDHLNVLFLILAKEKKNNQEIIYLTNLFINMDIFKQQREYFTNKMHYLKQVLNCEIKYEFYPKNWVIFEQGTYGNKYFIILKGEIDLYKFKLDLKENQDPDIEQITENTNIENGELENNQIQSQQKNQELEFDQELKQKLKAKLKFQVKLVKRRRKKEINNQQTYQRSLLNNSAIQDKYLTIDEIHEINQKHLQELQENKEKIQEKNYMDIFETASAICRVDTHLLTLTREGYNKIMYEYQKRLQQDQLDYFGKFEFLKYIPKPRLLMFLHSIKQAKFNKHNVIYNEGDKVENIYFIKDGEVEFTKLFDIQQSKQEDYQIQGTQTLKKELTKQRGTIFTLLKNNLFGEQEIINDQNYRQNKVEAISSVVEKLLEILQEYQYLDLFITDGLIRGEFIQTRQDSVFQSLVFKYQSIQKSKLQKQEFQQFKQKHQKQIEIEIKQYQEIANCCNHNNETNLNGLINHKSLISRLDNKKGKKTLAFLTPKQIFEIKSYIEQENISMNDQEIPINQSSIRNKDNIKQSLGLQKKNQKILPENILSQNTERSCNQNMEFNRKLNLKIDESIIKNQNIKQTASLNDINKFQAEGIFNVKEELERHKEISKIIANKGMQLAPNQYLKKNYNITKSDLKNYKSKIQKTVPPKKEKHKFQNKIQNLNELYAQAIKKFNSNEIQQNNHVQINQNKINFPKIDSNINSPKSSLSKLQNIDNFFYFNNALSPIANKNNQIKFINEQNEIQFDKQEYELQ
ncbi:Cyclic nucleotide-binding protein [Pseudocohnilembus persalinus]|uniref:Cyclic nucleotide-binding protein n=1 Tax=Pseudocohnilembus persalinus TaxID=266149 RepID=A0A0V0QG51_PSEPJ|nr:Cyclic nucleotide-binding protein [Pseudocohnilembus persalinus]|eukprot:KRX01056.1 Cyclic nucleotide-binding protein [Pseudocohnilembus persalinus]